mgnify:CR=1 FL=1
MKEFKGTQGRWSLSEDVNDNDRICIESGSSHNFIDCWSLGFCTTEEMRNNAKLIAAAPELLKALQNIRNAVYDISIPCYIMKEVDNAINKALD